MKKLNIKNKEIHILVLFGLLALLFISVNIANNYSPEGNYISDNDLPKASAVTINIISPSTNENFSSVPNFVIEISEDTDVINKTWYTLNTNQTKHFFTTNGSINGWQFLSDGSVNITFYANNSLSDVENAWVIVNKDTGNPTVSITYPTGGEYYDTTPPAYIVEISDSGSSIDAMWYTLDGGVNIPFTVNGSIDLGNWTALSDGLITIIFYANDSAGNINSDTVDVNKDTGNPSVSITYPTGGEYYDTMPPAYIVEMRDVNSPIDSRWYTLNGGSNIFFNTNGSIDLGNWTVLGDVAVTIVFYANDSAGNVGSDNVIVTKDTGAPTVSITSPTGGEYFDATPPAYVVEISDSDSPIDAMWYTLDGGVNIPFTVNGSIDLGNWTALSDGLITIIFYANDSAGNINSDTVDVNKDTGNPTVSITYPTGGEYYDTTPPAYIVEISDTDSPIDSRWYTLNGGSNIFFNTNGSIDLGNWTVLGDVAVTIVFYANDSAGNVGSDSVIVNKDTGAPTVTITYPTGGEYYDVTPPAYIVEISDANSPIDSRWYTLNGGSNIFFNTNGSIDLGNWTALGDVAVTIVFYANDSAGNVNSDTVIVNKDATDPTVDITSQTGGEYYDATAPSYTVEISDDNLDMMWYTLDGGMSIFFTTNDTFDPGNWTALGDGPLTIIFYANDSAGNVGSDSVIVNKDTTAPTINIISPLLGQTFGAMAPNFIVEINDEILDKMWYTLNGGMNIFFTTNGTIDPGNWTALGNGLVTIIFYANDTFGHTNFASRNFNKNADAPIINIVSPTLASYYGTDAPSFIVEITDTDLDTMWYTLDGGVTNITFIANGTIDQNNWTALVDGAVTLIFYANDLAGNTASEVVLINRDTAAPTINILSPTLNQLLGINSPSYYVEINDPILHTMWYNLDGGMNFSFTSNGTFNPSAWGDLHNGTATINFYANDSVGNEASVSFLVRVDKEMPIITVNLPVDDTVTGTQPIINITVNDTNVDSIWYRVGLTVITLPLSANNTDQLLDSGIWSLLPEGSFTIEFFANDTAGNLNNLYTIDLTKDILAPIVIIVDPLVNTTYSTAPQITLTINDATLDTAWYSIGGRNYTFSVTPGTNIVTINQTAWNALSNGEFTITFYANDRLGRESSDSIMLIRNVQEPFDFIAFLTDPLVLTILIGSIAIIVVVVVVVKRRKTHKTSDKEVRKIESLWD